MSISTNCGRYPKPHHKTEKKKAANILPLLRSSLVRCRVKSVVYVKYYKNNKSVLDLIVFLI